MEFCEICDNLLYLRAEKDNALTKYCKHCTFSKTQEANTGAVKIGTTLYSEDDLLYLQYQNRYLRCDPTLPRVNDPGIKCPNGDCKESREKPQVLYVKYHPVNMKYLYCCDYCGTTWNKNSSKE